MKNLALILGLLMVSAAFATPALAMGGGMAGGMGGRTGGGMMDNFGSGLFDWFQKGRNGGGYPNQGIEERKMDEGLDQQHQEDSAYLKYQIEMKEKEMDSLLKSTDPDVGKVRALNRDIRELRAAADQEQRNYELQTEGMNSGYRSGNRNGWSSYGSGGGSDSRGMGYGGQMGGYGSGRR
jgi:hypothetical protein